MKTSAKNDLRGKTADDLKAMAKEARDTMFKARISKSVEGKAIGIKYRDLRRQIARIETILGEKARAASTAGAK
jgi:ribosomal protein L29